MTSAFRIEPLGVSHARNEFSCGVEALDRYFVQSATQDVRRRLSNCFVACDAGGKVGAYYTFAAASFPLVDLPSDLAKRLPRYPLVPAGLIGRLAVDQRFQGQGLGGALVMDAARRAGAADPAIYALIVDAKDERAVTFYERLDFRRFLSRPMSLFLPIATALRGYEVGVAEEGNKPE